MTNKDGPESDWKASIFAAVLASMLTAGAMYIVESRATDVRLMELGVGILQDEPTRKNRPLRVWGARLLNEYSDIRLPDSLRVLLVDSISLPKSAIGPVVDISPRGKVRALREGKTIIVAGVDGVADTAVVEVRSDTTLQDTTP